MFHKISDFCDKIDSLKQDADRLRDYKYGSKKGTISTIEMNNLIEQIQSDCYIISQDKGNYEKTDTDNSEYQPS